jgi:glycosyltransferase involved in cell wall biosynthesis
VADGRTTVLQIIPELDAGGAEQSVVEIVAALVKAGARALVLAEPGGRLEPAVTAAGGEVHPFPAATKNPVRILANSLALARLASREGVQLIHARSRAPAWSALMAARGLGIPFVTTYHGAYSEPNAAKRTYNSVMARGDIVIANSRYTADLISSRYATYPERIRVVHRGVDTAAFDPKAIDLERVSALRARWNVPPGQPIILQAARLTRWKGQLALLDAVGRLRSRGALRNAVLVLAGDAQGRDSYVDELRSKIAELGLGAHVRLPGHVPVSDMPIAYALASATVVASIEPEAFGRTAIEAAALGCPVIATDIGAPLETVLAQPDVSFVQRTGWLVPPDDAEALAAALAEALALSGSERQDLAAAARRHVLAHFTTEVMQSRTLAVYDLLLGTTLEKAFDSDTSLMIS